MKHNSDKQITVSFNRLYVWENLEKKFTAIYDE